ncbi:MAG TPA: YidC/Oxa1 family insertase periplasmic-domain containing protein, partial [Bacteroidia bacterium]|nr:YidC/Oxa1 family insertase periplasmic-domain containing protein [Bacteroidia bacterium]
MDRNSIIGLLIIGLILIGFSIWNQPSAEELANRQKQIDSIEAVKNLETARTNTAAPAVAATATIPDSILIDSLGSSDSLKNLILVREFGDFASATQGTEQFSTLENDVIKVTFNNKGGRVYAVELKKYKTFDQKPLILFESDSTVFGLNFFAQN